MTSVMQSILVFEIDDASEAPSSKTKVVIGALIEIVVILSLIILLKSPV